MSRMAMNIPKHMVIKAIAWRSGIRVGALVASGAARRGTGSDAAIEVMTSFHHLARLLLLGGLDCASGPVVPLDAVSLRVDADDDRHTGPQQLLRTYGGRHLDAYRKPLHDLGEVAGRIVGRQQREHSA